MLIELDSFKEPTIDADICIVGGGAAGIVLALELMHTGRSIVLLEGGGLRNDPRAEALYELESTALPVKKNSRARVWGGTTTLWTGGWKLLDPEDFEAREWIPFSGWPITRADIEPFYDRAAERVGALTFRDVAALVGNQASTEFSQRVTESGALLPTILWELPPKKRDFGKGFRNILEASSSVRVFLNTNVTSIEQENGMVTSLVVRSLGGRKGNVRARWYVIACGGIENARLLLHSKVGTTHDQVGRYYMDHPKGTAGTIRATEYTLYAPVTGERKNAGGNLITGFQLAPTVRAHEHLPNSYVQIRPIYRDHSLFRRLLRKFFGVPYKIVGMHVRTFMEQVPSPENRVMLSEMRDVFGNPLARIEWSLSELDKKGARQLHHQLRVDLARTGLGELDSQLLTSTEEWPIATDASHHMGTTRMGHDPKTSVVDNNCRVHGMENIFVAGSSVFPTGGHANPTATILALAIRLADHLKTLP